MLINQLFSTSIAANPFFLPRSSLAIASRRWFWRAICCYWRHCIIKPFKALIARLETGVKLLVTYNNCCPKSDLTQSVLLIGGVVIRLTHRRNTVGRLRRCRRINRRRRRRRLIVILSPAPLLAMADAETEAGLNWRIPDAQPLACKTIVGLVSKESGRKPSDGHKPLVEIALVRCG